MREFRRTLTIAGLGFALALALTGLFGLPLAAQTPHDPGSSVAPAAEAAALVEHDTNLISPNCRSIYVATTGNIVVDMTRTGTNQTFTAVPAGTILPIRIKRFKTASTATGVCLY
jgi:hypothetical protein